MTRQNGPWYDEEYLRQGSPTNSTWASTCNRLDATGNVAIAASGVEMSVGVPLQAGDVVSSISFFVRTTAAGSPTAGYVCLRDTAGGLLAQSADFGSTARAANTAYKVALASSVLITTAGLYYIGISFTASTVPTLSGIDFAASSIMLGNLGVSAKIMSQTHGSAVGATAPATTATPTTATTLPFLVATS